jgi:alpha-L-fucosidase
MQRFGDERDRFFENRLGLFVHWGLYALPAWHEQILWRGTIKRREYESLIDEFNPTAYDPERWLDLLQDAGMSYLCFTTKHHDGFCMFDTEYTDYKITNTPYGRDVLAELAQACKSRGILLSLYYSLPDWHHPNCPNWGRHHEMFGPRAQDKPDEGLYLEYVRNQVRELLTNYGEIYQLFWDVNVAGYVDPGMNEMVRELQPGILINDRGPGKGDYSTPERHVPQGMVFETPTEACQSIGRESWGYRVGEDYYCERFLLQSIDRTLSMGGNYLLNVGPRADGSLPPEAHRVLERIGTWYGRVCESFEATIPASYLLGELYEAGGRYDRVLLTRRDNTFYAHGASGLSTSGMALPGIEWQPIEATVLNTGKEVATFVDVLPWRWRAKPCLRIAGLPVNETAGEPLVVRLRFSEEVVA